MPARFLAPSPNISYLMFPAHSHVQALRHLLPRGCICDVRRFVGTLSRSFLQTPNEVAEQLEATGVWRSGSDKRTKKVKGDKYRVNVTDEGLCNDIIKYIKPSLLRHKGCDIIDIYPGAGVWSRKLHKLLRPRSHILMEPNTELYTPFLKPLLKKKGVTMVPNSGIVWGELNEILSPEYLPHQVERDPATRLSETPERNDTLLVVANLSLYPRKKFQNFGSMAQLLLYQFISAIRTSSLFQKYGLVRMLIWTLSDDSKHILPKLVQHRRRSAIEAELNTEWLMEIAGPDASIGKSGAYVRDSNIDTQSARNVLARMCEQGVATPRGRETEALRNARAVPHNMASLVGRGAAEHRFSAQEELNQLEADLEAGHFEANRNTSAEFHRLCDLKSYAKWRENRNNTILELKIGLDAVLELYRAGRLEEAAQKDAEWNNKFNSLGAYLRNDYLLVRDNEHLFLHDPPILSWDRRTIEPLVTKPSEFYPNVACSLLDIQPKAPHPLLREMGPQSATRSGDVFEILLPAILQNSALGVSKGLENIYPGAADGIVPNCPSLHSPVSGWGEQSPRTLSESQLLEVLDAWMKWPFAPQYRELVGRGAEESEETMEDDAGLNADLL